MTERKYSMLEIDRMRDALNFTYLVFNPGQRDPAREDARIENMLRTYMLNGTEPEEVESYAATAIERYNAKFAEYRAREVAHRDRVSARQ